MGFCEINGAEALLSVRFLLGEGKHWEAHSVLPRKPRGACRQGTLRTGSYEVIPFVLTRGQSVEISGRLA